MAKIGVSLSFFSVFNAGSSFNVAQITNGWLDADAYRSTFIYNFQNTAFKDMDGISAKTAPAPYTDKCKFALNILFFAAQI